MRRLNDARGHQTMAPTVGSGERQTRGDAFKPGLYIGVVGPGAAADTASQGDDEAGRQAREWLKLATEVGREIASVEAALVCGGLGGVMNAACRGAAERGGLAIGLLPGVDRADANQHVTVALTTGLGELRNGLVVNCSDVLIAIGGSWGTLNEVSLAMKLQKHVVALGGWKPPHSYDSTDWLHTASSAHEAVKLALGPRMAGS